MHETGGSRERGHLACPFCNSYDVTRLFVASVRRDSCECASCAASWEEDAGSGTHKGRSTGTSVFMPLDSLYAGTEREASRRRVTR